MTHISQISRNDPKIEVKAPLPPGNALGPGIFRGIITLRPDIAPPGGARARGPKIIKGLYIYANILESSVFQGLAKYRESLSSRNIRGLCDRLEPGGGE